MQGEGNPRLRYRHGIVTNGAFNLCTKAQNRVTIMINQATMCVFPTKKNENKHRIPMTITIAHL